MTQMQVTRNYKDSMFRTIFSDKESLAELYEALSGEQTDADSIELRTIEAVVYATLKNDIAFTVGDKVVVLLEHMATVSYNLPLRMLSYVTRVLEGMRGNRDVYRRKNRLLPKPEFFVFYNGEEQRPIRETLYLSDNFRKADEDTTLELKVEVINVNYELGAELLQKCKKLNLYSRIVSRSRELLFQGHSLENAMTQIEGELRTDEDGRKFFSNYGLGGIKMLFEELTEEEYREIERENGREEGLEEGRKEGLEKAFHIVVKNMKEKGIPTETIVEITGLPRPEIEAL